MVATAVEELRAVEAKKRMSEGGGDKKSEAARSGLANLPDPIQSRNARDEAAELLNVSLALSSRRSA